MTCTVAWANKSNFAQAAADYNFNWQRFYYLEDPKILPTGSTLYVNAVFDNSEQNEFNPDPDKTLYFGDQTFDEMMIGYMSITFVNEDNGVGKAGSL